MAKIKHRNFLNTVHEVFTDAKQAGVFLRYAGGQSFSGRTIEVGGRELYHFGTTGNLGPDQDFRLKEASLEKRKLGANFYKRYSYLQTIDNFILEMIGGMEGRY